MSRLAFGSGRLISGCHPTNIYAVGAFGSRTASHDLRCTELGSGSRAFRRELHEVNGIAPQYDSLDRSEVITTQGRSPSRDVH